MADGETAGKLWAALEEIGFAFSKYLSGCEGQARLQSHQEYSDDWGGAGDQRLDTSSTLEVESSGLANRLGVICETERNPEWHLGYWLQPLDERWYHLLIADWLRLCIMLTAASEIRQFIPIYLLTYFKIYLKIWVTEKGRDRKIYYSLIRSPNSRNGQGCAVPKPGAGSFFQVSYIADRGSSSWTIFRCFF